MTEYVYVKPAEGGRIRMPDRDSTVMPAEGQLVPRIDYYERLIISGDVAICEPPKADKPIKERPAPAMDADTRR